MAAKTTGAPNEIPDEFEPLCHWEKDEGRVTLVVHLPDFQKEQLRVQINTQGVLMITGERKVENKTSRFRKEIKVPADCNSNEIQAKFCNGLLSIIMPKMVKKGDEAPHETKQEEKESEKPPASNNETGNNGKESEKPPVSNNQTGNNGENKEKTSHENAAAALLSAYRPPLMQTLGKKEKTVIAGVAVAVVVAIGAYVAYKYWYN